MDHLGSPRIEVDQTGSLGSVKRHDYLPFGEEVKVGVGTGSLRTTGMGYELGQVVGARRQKFGTKERDIETGLDYFLARYYLSVQGRFTSVDPENAGAILDDPQSWNGYAYARNSPIVFGDPSGKDYKLCTNGGQCSYHNDTNIALWKQGDGVRLENGKIFDKSGNQFGTYQCIDSRYGYFSTEQQGRLLTESLPEASDSVQKGVGIVATPYALGAGIAGGGAMLGVGGVGSGLTTLGGLSPSLLGEVSTVLAGYGLSGSGQILNGVLTLRIAGVAGQFVSFG